MNLIFHIPHASLRIPDYGQYLLPRDAVDTEALHLTDLYTDELFVAGPHDTLVQADFCRVYCDVERFDNDALEPMSKFGMGATYVQCDDGRQLRSLTPAERDAIMQTCYFPHHKRFSHCEKPSPAARGSQSSDTFSRDNNRALPQESHWQVCCRLVWQAPRSFRHS